MAPPDAATDAPYAPYAALTSVAAKQQAAEGSAPARTGIIYGRRWWLVFCLSALGVLQSAEWNFYSPISVTIEKLEGWDDSFCEWAANIAGIVFTVTVLFWSAFIERYGVRLGACLAVLFSVVCSVLRLVPLTSPDARATLVSVSMVFNGLSAPPIGLLPPIIAARWHPLSERTTATGIMVMANYLGQAVGFALGPWTVPFEHGHAIPNSTCSRNQDCGGDGVCVHGGVCELTCVAEWTPQCAGMRRRLDQLYWAEAAAAVAILLGFLAYFPSHAPTPPTLSAEARHEAKEMTPRESWRLLISNWPFLLLVLTFGIPTGILSSFMASLDVNLKSLDLDQAAAATIGVMSILGGVVGGTAVPAVVDWIGKRRRDRRRRAALEASEGEGGAAHVHVHVAYAHDHVHPPLKWAIVVLYAIASVALLLFAASSVKMIPSNLWFITLLVVVGGGSINGTIPLFYELCVEQTYPVGEGPTEAGLVFAQNLFQSIFLAIPLGGNPAWLNWTLAAVVPFATVCLVPFKAQFLRSQVDIQAAGGGAS